MQPVLTQGLPTMGTVRMFPQALAHGPFNYNGLDIPNLFMEQTITHVEILIKYHN